MLIYNRIISRALRGIGGSGVYTMTYVILPKMVPSAQYSLYSTILAVVGALSSLLGPVIGGVVANHSEWK